jgi:hypothetical protein
MSTGESTGSGTDRPTRLGAGEPSRLGAVVLTGGTGARLGHVDKASLRLAGVSLLVRRKRSSWSVSRWPPRSR